MTVLFTTEYFPPFIHGGAEVSILELGKALVKRGIKVCVLTPNYGTKKVENVSGIRVIRYFFLKKLEKLSDLLTPMWHFNPIFWLSLLYSVVKTVQEEKIDIIHCQGLYSLPSSVLASKILQIPLVVTFRDNQLLCNYGYCLIRDQFEHSCNFRKYFQEDFRDYFQNKVLDKSIFSFIIQLTQAINGRLRTNILKYFAHFAKIKIVSSSAQQRTFAASGFVTDTIYNLYPFQASFPKNTSTGDYLLYATKLSSGKGLDLLLNSIPKVLKSYPKIKLVVIGRGDTLRYKKLCKDLNIDNNVKFKSMPSFHEVRVFRSRALLEVCPSIYPESFGRAALESLAVGVPVVVTNRGGLSEIVEDGQTGVVVEPNENDLSLGIIRVIKYNATFRKNIKSRYSDLQKTFYDTPVSQTLDVYQKLCC